MTYHATASHLLVYKLSEVALIDTTGSFSPLRLRDVLVFRLEAQSQRDKYQRSGYVYEKSSSKTRLMREQLVEEATSMLGRVKVMRVFDLAGVVEAVGEIGEMRERNSQLSQKVIVTESTKRREAVGDSEDELEEEDENSMSKHVSHSSLDAEDDDSSGQPDLHNGRVGMIVVDTITNVVSSITSKSQIQGQALLASFMRSLHHLTFRHHICTILTNAAVGLNPSNNPEYHRRPEDNVSIFASTLGKPALGKTFTFLIDTSIFLSAVPKTMDDAQIAFGDGGEATSAQKALVLEVLRDRCGPREGRWVAFEIVADIKLVPCLV